MSESTRVLVVDNDADSLLLLRLILGSRPEYEAARRDAARALLILGHLEADRALG